MGKIWTVKLEKLVQHVAFVEVEADTASEAVLAALGSDPDFVEECDACDAYVYSVTDGNGDAYDFGRAQAGGFGDVGQTATGIGIESVTPEAIDSWFEGQEISRAAADGAPSEKKNKGL